MTPVQGRIRECENARAARREAPLPRAVMDGILRPTDATTTSRTLEWRCHGRRLRRDRLLTTVRSRIVLGESWRSSRKVSDARERFSRDDFERRGYPRQRPPSTGCPADRRCPCSHCEQGNRSHPTGQIDGIRCRTRSAAMARRPELVGRRDRGAGRLTRGDLCPGSA